MSAKRQVEIHIDKAAGLAIGAHEALIRAGDSMERIEEARRLLEGATCALNWARFLATNATPIKVRRAEKARKAARS